MNKLSGSLFILLFLLSCGPGKQENASWKSADETAPAAMLEADARSANAPASDLNISIGQKLIREGELTFETSDVRKSRQLIVDAVNAYKGYISSDQIYDYDQRKEYRLIVRVPSVNFDRLLDTISNSAARIEVRNVNTRDVTEEFVDIEARLKTKKELEARYLELMKKAQRVEDLVSIEREIGNLRSEIESIEGRLKYLQNQVSFSTLNITFYERTPRAFGFSLKFTEALKGGWSNFLGFIIVLVNLWPFLLAGGLAAIFIYSYNRRKTKK